MINKNTLMLGNIISRQFYNPNPRDSKTMIEHCVVCSIGETFCNTSHLDKSRLKVKYEFLEPIKLTKDWLLFFDFISVRTTYSSDFFVKKEFVLRPYIDDDSNETDAFYHVGMIKGKIEYVHELQNLYFTLSGQQLKKIVKCT